MEKPEIMALLNRCVDDVIEVGNLADEGARDALNFAANLFGVRLDDPDATLGDAAANYSTLGDDPGRTPEEALDLVVSWFERA